MRERMVLEQVQKIDRYKYRYTFHEPGRQVQFPGNMEELKPDRKNRNT